MGDLLPDDGSLWLSREQKERIQKEFKIPVDSFNPGKYWFVSLDEESFMPTDEELRQLQSLCRFEIKDTCQIPRLIELILQKPLPVLGGHNTKIFRKGRMNRKPGTENHWFYRHMFWCGDGGEYVPYPMGKDYKPHSLIQVMDRSQSVTPTRLTLWEEWKKVHTDIFHRESAE